MSEIADLLKQRFEDRLSGELESCEVKSLNGKRIYWRPLTGTQQKQIQKYAEKSVAEGICMHVKMRALDEKGEPIFKDIPVIGLMNDFDFTRDIVPIFSEMTGTDLSDEDISGN